MRASLFEVGSLDVTAVRPLEPVVLEWLSDRPSGSPLAIRDSAFWSACLRSALLSDVDDDVRLVFAA